MARLEQKGAKMLNPSAEMRAAKPKGEERRGEEGSPHILAVFPKIVRFSNQIRNSKKE
jgi:hypothetical protein